MQRPLPAPTLLQRGLTDPTNLDLFRGYMTDLVNVVNTSNQGVGASLASATTIKPTNAIHHVTGTTTIETIVAPPGFSGPIYLIVDGAWSTGTGGNISIAFTPTVGAVRAFVYDPTTATWYPTA